LTGTHLEIQEPVCGLRDREQDRRRGARAKFLDMTNGEKNSVRVTDLGRKFASLPNPVTGSGDYSSLSRRN